MILYSAFLYQFSVFIFECKSISMLVSHHSMLLKTQTVVFNNRLKAQLNSKFSISAFVSNYYL